MAKKCLCKKPEEHPDETWLVPYADILTLLLALFIVLFSSSNMDKEKAGQLEQAFTAAFSSAPIDQNHGTLLNFMEDLKEIEIENDATLGSDSSGALIEITSFDMFEEGSNRVKMEYINILSNVTKLLKQNKYQRFNIVIEGHTDNDEAIKFRSGSTWELSSARSSAVVEEFINLGIVPQRLRAVGMADIAPKHPNLNPYGEKIPENQKKNRRITIRIEP